MGRVENKVAFVTGAARGQGRSHALALAREGADIIAVDICEDIDTNNYPLSSYEDLQETARLVEQLDRRVVIQKADVRDSAALRDALSKGIAELGKVDIVVANAGICPLGADVPIKAFTDVMDVNFSGVVNAVGAALPHLGEGASIICTGSIGAFLPNVVDGPQNGPGGAGYNLAKQYVANFVHNLALELGSHKIRINAVHPTNCNTDMLQSEPMYKIFRPDLENPTREDCLEAFATMTILGNPWVEPQDISNAVLFLASDESRYVTGLQLRVDAGAYVRYLPFHT